MKTFFLRSVELAFVYVVALACLQVLSVLGAVAVVGGLALVAGLGRRPQNMKLRMQMSQQPGFRTTLLVMLSYFAISLASFFILAQKFADSPGLAACFVMVGYLFVVLGSLGFPTGRATKKRVGGAPLVDSVSSQRELK